jgi:hypothetical protein
MRGEISMKAERVLIIFIILLVFFAFQCGKKPTVPDDLIGVWKTSTPQYEDRFFEIKKDEIIFGTGEGNSDTHRINNIEMEKIRGVESRLYTIHYKNLEGQECKFSFYYDPTKRGVIRFKNQEKMVWTREES